MTNSLQFSLINVLFHLAVYHEQGNCNCPQMHVLHTVLHTWCIILQSWIRTFYEKGISSRDCYDETSVNGEKPLCGEHDRMLLSTGTISSCAGTSTYWKSAGVFESK